RRLAGEPALARPRGAQEVMTGDAVGSDRRGERRVALVDAEGVELGQLAGQVGAVAVDVVPPRRAFAARKGEGLAAPAGRVLLRGRLRHLEVQHRRESVLHGRGSYDRDNGGCSGSEIASAPMDLSFTEEERAFAAEFRAWLGENLELPPSFESFDDE